MSRAGAELSWEIATGEEVVRVTADRVDAARQWGLHDPAGAAPPDDGELDDDELRLADLF